MSAWRNPQVLIGLEQLVVHELVDPSGCLVHTNTRIEIGRR
jgi:hypothetical protein